MDSKVIINWKLKNRHTTEKNKQYLAFEVAINKQIQLFVILQVAAAAVVPIMVTPELIDLFLQQ